MKMHIRVKRRTCLYFRVLIALAAIVLLILFESRYITDSWFPFNSKTKYPLSSSIGYHGTSETHLKGYHLLLWWDVPLWIIDEHFHLVCKSDTCKYPNCHVTYDQLDLNRSSAVLVPVSRTDVNRVPKSPPANRNADQPWIFFSLESPLSFSYKVFNRSAWQNVFNWSMTYHRNADIPIPYGWLVQRHTPPDKNYTDIFRRKTKQVLWIVSHCWTSSRREKYIQQLQKIIPVDTYGGCFKSRLDVTERQTLFGQYKFYLGFENAFCEDYVTEKFFYYFQHDMVIVVRGLANYNSILPKKTFINTADFPSAESLGKYLLKLSEDETEYTNYLREINKYSVLGTYDNYCEGLCTICEKVNNVNKNRKTYGNVIEYLHGQCEQATDLG